MIIPISDKFRVNSDRHNWILQENKGIAKKDGRGIKKGEIIWRAISYHQKLRSLLDRLVEIEVRETDTKTLAEALDAVPHICRRLTQAFDLVAEVKFREETENG